MAKRPNSFWNDNNSAELKRMWYNPMLSVQDIADTLGTTVSAVVSKRKRLGLDVKPKLKKKIVKPRRWVVEKVGPSSKPVEPKSRHLSLVQLHEHACKWPEGDGPFTFCGAQKKGWEPYCDYHMWQQERHDGHH